MNARSKTHHRNEDRFGSVTTPVALVHADHRGASASPHRGVGGDSACAQKSGRGSGQCLSVGADRRHRQDVLHREGAPTRNPRRPTIGDRARGASRLTRCRDLCTATNSCGRHRGWRRTPDSRVRQAPPPPSRSRCTHGPRPSRPAATVPFDRSTLTERLVDTPLCVTLRRANTTEGFRYILALTGTSLEVPAAATPTFLPEQCARAAVGRWLRSA
jgi:hypothetical protein